jgi:hypothetical protein
MTTNNRKPAHNSTYKKLAVQWLNEVQFFNQTFVQVDSFVLRNRQLLIAAKRYMQLNDAVRKQAEVFCGQLCSKLTTQSAQGKQTFTFWTKLQVVSLTA